MSPWRSLYMALALEKTMMWFRMKYRVCGNLHITTDQYWFHTVYPNKYAHGFCFAVLCCGYTLTDFPISIRLTSLALWQSNDCPSASKATLMNMDKYFMWIHYERLHNHNKAKHNKTVCIFLGIYCRYTYHRLILDALCSSIFLQITSWCIISIRMYFVVMLDNCAVSHFVNIYICLLSLAMHHFVKK